MELKVPEIGEDIFEAKIVEWFVKEGDRVKKDQDLVELVTDKASFVVPSPINGRLSKIYKEEGDVLGADMLLAEIDPE